MLLKDCPFCAEGFESNHDSGISWYSHRCDVISINFAFAGLPRDADMIKADVEKMKAWNTRLIQMGEHKVELRESK